MALSKGKSVAKAFRRGGRRIRIKLADQRQKIRAARALRPKKPRRAQGRMRNFGIEKKRYLLAIPVLAALIALVCAFKFGDIQHFHYRPLDATAVNPLMGWAVDATTDPEEVGIEHSLVYATVTWREFEKEKGVYDFESFEQKNRLNEWWARGKRAVIRFVMDAPGDERHMDIPDWLYAALGDSAGVYYDNALGSGFSPNYTDIRLIAAHKDAIAALGARYDDNGGIAFVEIGSVGHYGSWSTQGVDADWSLPPNEDINNWIWHYTRAFSKTRLLAPKPYQPVRVMGIGLYNDNLGSQSATWDWIDKIEYGGYDAQTGADFRSMPEILSAWLSAGSIDKSVSAERLFTLGFDSLIKQIGYCHTTYISGISGVGLSDEVKSNMDVALGSMGYRLWVREASWQRAIRAGYFLMIDARLRNDASQCFMYDWPMEISLMRGDEVEYSFNTDVDIRSIMPGGGSVTFKVDLPDDIPIGVYEVALAVIDPDTGRPAVDLAMDVSKVDLRAKLGTVEVFK